MTLKKLLLSVIALGAFASPACARAQEEITPALYVARDADSTLYLYGTVHIRPRGADWGNADVRAALAESQEIWTELEISPAADAESQALAAQLGAAPPGRPLSSWLNAEENAALAALQQRLGIPAGALEGLQPWVAALTLTVVPMMQAGYDPNSGVDRAIDAFGDSNGKTMRSFETVEQQLSFLAGLPAEVQREMLREAIAQADDATRLMADMSAAWASGDEGTLSRLVVDDTRTQYPELYDVLFKQRNDAWMQTIVQELNGAGVDFVAVGAGHMLGPDGLVAQLRARGYTVERVD